MMRWLVTGGVALGILFSVACSRGDADRAREQGREAQERAQRRLRETRDKLREELQRADQQTREDLDKARKQLNQALDQSKRDADKARERLRDRDRNSDDNDSHQ